MEEYMLDYQRMLDGPDSPSEVRGEVVGDCAGGVLDVREADGMGRVGGAKGGDAEPLPMSKDSILSCPEHRSDDVGSEGVNSILPRDERGCVTEEVVRPVMDRPKPTLGPSIPCGTRFSQWVEAHRESMSYQRQSKR